MKIFAVALLFFWPAIAAAAETVTAITATAWSYHFARKDSDCEFNPGLGLEHGRDLRAHVGVYSNTDCRFSAYGGVSYTQEFARTWRAGVALLAFTGYHSENKVDAELKREDKAKLAPVLVLGYEGKSRGFNLGWIPGEDLLVKLGVKEDDGRAKFKGLIFLQFKVLKW